MTNKVDFNPDDIIAMLEEEAYEYCQTHNIIMRVVSKDGQHRILTMDLRNDRVNVTIRHGLVIEARIG